MILQKDTMKSAKTSESFLTSTVDVTTRPLVISDTCHNFVGVGKISTLNCVSTITRPHLVGPLDAIKPWNVWGSYTKVDSGHLNVRPKYVQ